MQFFVDLRKEFKKKEEKNYNKDIIEFEKRIIVIFYEPNNNVILEGWKILK
jgi:hypothetical protein